MRIPCKSCGSKILKATIDRFEGYCAQCHRDPAFRKRNLEKNRIDGLLNDRSESSIQNLVNETIGQSVKRLLNSPDSIEAVIFYCHPTFEGMWVSFLKSDVKDLADWFYEGGIDTCHHEEDLYEFWMALGDLIDSSDHEKRILAAANHLRKQHTVPSNICILIFSPGMDGDEVYEYAKQHNERDLLDQLKFRISDL